MSRRPRLVKDLVRQVDFPKLQRDVLEGALAESEAPNQITRMERTVRFQSGTTLAPSIESSQQR